MVSAEERTPVELAVELVLRPELRELLREQPVPLALRLGQLVPVELVLLVLRPEPREPEERQVPVKIPELPGLLEPGVLLPA